MKQKDKLFDGLAPPAPPPELRTRVLAAARAQASQEPVHDVWTRIWDSRWLRVIWATSVAALVIAHITVAPGRPSPRMFTAGFHKDTEFAELLREMRIEESASPNLGRAAGDRRKLLALDDGGNGS